MSLQLRSKFRFLLTFSLFALACLCIANVAMAQDEEDEEPEEQPIKPAKILIEDGKPMNLIVGDGRVAILRQAVVDSPKRFSLPFTVHDNSCNDNIGMTCKLTFPFRKVWYYWAWDRHKDAKKVGQIVQRVQVDEDTNKPGPPAPLEISATFIGTEKAFIPKSTLGMGDVKVECEDFSWLPSAQKTAPESLSLTRWDAELMFENGETGVAENRTLGGFIDPQFIRSSDQALTLQSLTGISGLFNPNAFPFGDVLTWTMPTANGDLCMAELKPGTFEQLVMDSAEVDKMRPPPAKGSIYMWGSDDFSREYRATQTFFINPDIIKSPESFDVKELR